MRVGYSTSAELAKAIGDLWTAKGRVGFKWPYNRFQWDSGHTWWVVPAPDRVAFRYAKIIATTTPRLVEGDVPVAVEN